MKLTRISHVFVEEIPASIDPGVVYVSIEYGTAVHSCCCGCGNEVVTPLTPVDWRLIYDGETISLDPSVGNWSLECRSHYWIRRGEVVWARAWSEEEIEENRADDRALKARFFRSKRGP
ncbi:MAG: hypothetical protein GY725_08995 [bacterium]|nr:hypothetical protein [bacterium]